MVENSIGGNSIILYCEDNLNDELCSWSSDIIHVCQEMRKGNVKRSDWYLVCQVGL